VTELLSFRKENHRHTFGFNKKTKSSTYRLGIIMRIHLRHFLDRCPPKVQSLWVIEQHHWRQL